MRAFLFVVAFVGLLEASALAGFLLAGDGQLCVPVPLKAAHAVVFGVLGVWALALLVRRR